MAVLLEGMGGNTCGSMQIQGFVHGGVVEFAGKATHSQNLHFHISFYVGKTKKNIGRLKKVFEHVKVFIVPFSLSIYESKRPSVG